MFSQLFRDALFSIFPQNLENCDRGSYSLAYIQNQSSFQRQYLIYFYHKRSFKKKSIIFVLNWRFYLTYLDLSDLSQYLVAFLKVIAKFYLNRNPRPYWHTYNWNSLFSAVENLVPGPEENSRKVAFRAFGESLPMISSPNEQSWALQLLTVQVRMKSLAIREQLIIDDSLLVPPHTEQCYLDCQSGITPTHHDSITIAFACRCHKLTTFYHQLPAVSEIHRFGCDSAATQR